MKHREIVKSIQFMIPDSQFTLVGDELTWLDQNNTKPTKKEIEEGWIAYQAAQEAEAKAKAAAKSALLEKLGITQDEANFLLN